MIKWDENSGIRERLALLAHKGPIMGNSWRYDSRCDCWTLQAHGSFHVKVKTEGSESLVEIWKRWQLTRAEAMALIGYPETESVS